MPDFKKYFYIQAEPELVFQALTQEATASLWTGQPASIDARVGGEFSLWEDSIVGKFLEIEAPGKIVQEWYFGEDSGQSVVTIKLHPHKKGTSLELNHTGIPEEAFEDITAGWVDVYMASLLDFYDESTDI